MYKIGVISDTHGLLRPEVIKALGGCQAILHAGDFDKREILETLTEIAPLYAVLGNNDGQLAAELRAKPWRMDLRSLPETLSFELYGIRFFMTHDKKDIPRDVSAFDVVIYGHSHKYEEIRSGHQLLLNPGSCGPRRFRLPVTMAILEIGENGVFHVERIDLGQTDNTDGQRSFRSILPFLKPEVRPSEISNSKNRRSPDIKRITELVIRDTEKGIPVARIAERHHISPELAEQICRLYLTHPGINAEGILRKMGL